MYATVIPYTGQVTFCKVLEQIGHVYLVSVTLQLMICYYVMLIKNVSTLMINKYSLLFSFFRSRFLLLFFLIYYFSFFLLRFLLIFFFLLPVFFLLFLLIHQILQNLTITFYCLGPQHVGGPEARRPAASEEPAVDPERRNGGVPGHVTGAAQCIKNVSFWTYGFNLL